MVKKRPEKRGFPFKPGSLGWRILLSLTLLSLGPLLIVTFQGYSDARQAVVDIQSTHLRAAIETKVERVKSWLTEIKACLTFAAALPDKTRCCLVQIDSVKGDEAMRKCCMLNYIGMHNCCFTRIDSFDHDWTPLMPRKPGKCGISGVLTLSEEFKSSMTRSEQISISPPFKKGDDPYSFYMGLRVNAEMPENDSYIVSQLRLTGCVAQIFKNNEGLGGSGKVYLISDGGQLLTTYRNGAGLDQAAALLPALMLDSDQARTAAPSVGFSKLSAGSSGEEQEMPAFDVFIYNDASGNEVLGTSARIPELGWSVVAEIDRGEAFAWLGVLRTRAVLTATLTLALLLLLAGWISGRLSRPMRELARVARSIGSGHSDDRLGPLEGAEADEVGKAFNAMLDKLETNRIRLQQASALAAVGQLSTSMVHEMRNPLSSVKMNLKALQHQVEGNADYMELSDIALTQAARLEKMLTDLLNYGKPLQLQPRRIRFDKVAADVKQVVESYLAEKEVSLEIENDLNGTLFYGDQEQIWRALTNLVVNAIQAAPTGGRVSLSASTSDQGGFVALAVEDDGPGVPEQNRDKIFQPFFTTRGSGTGLGLANVKKIAEHHGGRIELVQGERCGARFVLHVPTEEERD